MGHPTPSEVNVARIHHPTESGFEPPTVTGAERIGAGRALERGMVAAPTYCPQYPLRGGYWGLYVGISGRGE